MPFLPQETINLFLPTPTNHKRETWSVTLCFTRWDADGCLSAVTDMGLEGRESTRARSEAEYYCFYSVAPLDDLLPVKFTLVE